MRLLVLVVPALVLACSEPTPPTLEDTSSSSGTETSSSSSEESTASVCDTSEHGWCTQTCIVPTGTEVVDDRGERAGNLCSVVSHVAEKIDCGGIGGGGPAQRNACFKAVAEVYGGGRYDVAFDFNGNVTETADLWEMALGWTSGSQYETTCLELEASCTVVSYEDCMAATSSLTGPDGDARDYACREIVARYPAAGLPPASWP